MFKKIEFARRNVEFHVEIHIEIILILLAIHWGGIQFCSDILQLIWYYTTDYFTPFNDLNNFLFHNPYDIEFIHSIFEPHCIYSRWIISNLFTVHQSQNGQHKTQNYEWFSKNINLRIQTVMVSFGAMKSIYLASVQSTKWMMCSKGVLIDAI